MRENWCSMNKKKYQKWEKPHNSTETKSAVIVLVPMPAQVRSLLLTRASPAITLAQWLQTTPSSRICLGWMNCETNQAHPLSILSLSRSLPTPPQLLEKWAHNKRSLQVSKQGAAGLFVYIHNNYTCTCFVIIHYFTKRSTYRDNSTNCS